MHRGGLRFDGPLEPLLERIYVADLRRFRPSRRPWVSPLDGSRNRARRSIHHHYDLGNDFYRLWLDREMVYTCAYFPTPEATLEDAQIAKMDLVCRKLQLRPGETVVEAGCGWGSLALHMARQYGVRVRAFNISHEQIAYARERAAREQLRGVEFIEDDYRNISGTVDAFVSVGMLEHVGRAHYPELAAVMRRVLTADGRGLLHFIGRNQPRRLSRWIRRRVFPGAYAPVLGEVFGDILEPGNFSVIDVENLRLHYALTLRHWRERYDNHADEVSARYGPWFLRTWRMYLAGIRGRIRHRQPAAVPGALRSRRDQPRAVDPGLARRRPGPGMTDWDVIVVGGGPGGSTCARRLVDAGRRVLLVDAAEFPREKPCAGWITPPVLDMLGLTPAALSEAGLTVEPITGFETGLIGQQPVRTTYGRAVSYGIRRVEFDAFLLRRSRAGLQLGTRVTSLARRDGAWVVNETWRAPVLVGAGGHFCPVARSLEPRTETRPRDFITAQEVEIALAPEAARRAPSTPEFHFCRDLEGYGWVFRKGQCLNVGFGRRAGPGFPAHATGFQRHLAARYDLPREALERWKGHAYLLAPDGRPSIGDGVLLVGDAAGLADAASGEGIRAAVESGGLAADTIVAAAGDYARHRLAPYAEALARRYGHRRNTGLSWLLPATVKRALAPALMRSPWFARRVLLDAWFLKAS